MPTPWKSAYDAPVHTGYVTAATLLLAIGQDVHALSPVSKRVCNAEVIITAKLVGIAPAPRNTPHGYVRLVFEHLDVIKGDSEGRALVAKKAFMVAVGAPSPFTEADLRQLQGRTIVVFGYIRPPEIHVDLDPECLSTISRDGIAEIRRQVQAQAELARLFPIEPWGRRTTDDERVARIVDGLTSNEVEAVRERVHALEAIGCSAVPALIRQLDDRRRFVADDLMLDNHGPHSFEAWRHYKPEVLTDAIAAILDQIVGEHVGPFVANGASPERRRRAVAAWRTWLGLLGGVPRCKA